MTGIRIAPSGTPLYVGAIPPGIQVAQSGGGALSLLTGLVSYWNLNEPNGIRSDSAGTNNLTDNGGVGSALGKQGNAASFVRANTEYLSTPIDRGAYTTISLALWFYVDADFATTGIASWGIGTLDNNPFLIFQLDTGTVRLFVDGGVRITTPVIIGAWYHAVITYDGADWKLYLDNDLKGTYTGAYGTLSGLILYLGSGFQGYFDGRIDEVGFWDRALAGSEIAALYNGGSGITYPFT
jgi:hypothetical protein